MTSNGVNPQTFIFLGNSGSGKGTQARLLESYIQKKNPEASVFYLETGNHFREFIQSSSYSAELSRALYEKGERQPDFLAVHMWSKALINELSPRDTLIIDGTPRSLPEAEILSTALVFYNRSPAHFIFLNVSRAWSEERLRKRGRSDDTDVVKRIKRLDWFDLDVKPALVYVENNPAYTLHEINGEQSIEKVHTDIISDIFS